MFAKFIFGCVVVTLGFTGTAQAVTINVEAIGTFTDGTDQTGVFGAAGTNLTGLSVVMDYQFDTTLGTTHVSPGFTEILGGSSYGTTTPLITSTVTVEGTSVSISGVSYSWMVDHNLGGTIVHQYVTAESGTTGSAIFLSSGSGSIPDSLTTPFSATFPAGGSNGNANGEFVIGRSGVVDGHFVSQNASGGFNISEITVNNGPILSAVPEPSTWAMMLLGFAGIGFIATSRGLRRGLRGHHTHCCGIGTKCER
jgi:hypothetical protein